MTPFSIQPASDHSLLISFGNEISRAAHEKVYALAHRLLHARFDFISNIHPAYHSLLVAFDPRLISHSQIESRLRPLLTDPALQPTPPARRMEIPVCYDDDFGVDLEEVAAHTGQTREEVIALHAGGDYYVAFIGFTPGFPYLAGMSPRLAVPRLPTPRSRVPAGSVAIGGAQTGIYPVGTPGGWRIIGRTPIALFLPDREPPALLALGDTVRFRPISREEFDRLHEARF